MASGTPLACERCGRLVTREKGCPAHRGARMLDLTRDDDRAWRQGVLNLRRHRHLRLASAIFGTAAMLAALYLLTDLVASGTSAHLNGQVGVADSLSTFLHGFSALLALGGGTWGGVGAIGAIRTVRTSQDTIERQAASRELVRRITALAAAVAFAFSVVVLREVLIGVPAELVAAATALVLIPPLQSILDFVVEGRRQVRPTVSEPTSLLPPLSEEAPTDSRVDDPLEQARQSALRQSIMKRR